MTLSGVGADGGLLFWMKRARLLCYLVLCVSRAVLSVVLGAWSVRFVGWADWVDCRCFLSFVFLGVARCLELSPCNTLGRILHNVGTSQLKRRGCIIHMPCMHDLGRALSDDWNARRCSARHIFGRCPALYFCCTSTDDRLSREIRISRSFRSVTPGPSFSNDRYQRWSNRTDR